MNALYFVANVLLSLYLFVFILRVLLQWVRADFRNPIAQAVLRLTNWLVLPLRRALPPVGKVDAASVVAVVLVAAAMVALLSLLLAGRLPDPIEWLRLTALEIVRNTLQGYFYAILFYALLSLVAPGGYSPPIAVLASLCEPVLAPIRRLIPPIAGLDLSPLWAGIAIQAILILLH